MYLTGKKKMFGRPWSNSCTRRYVVIAGEEVYVRVHELRGRSRTAVIGGNDNNKKAGHRPVYSLAFCAIAFVTIIIIIIFYLIFAFYNFVR